MDAELVQALRNARTTLVQVIDALGRSPNEAPLRSVLDAIERVESTLHAEPTGTTQRRAAASEASEDSERAALEQRVRELTRKLALSDEFLSTLGHELRNPLAPIYMQAQYLLDAVRQGEPKRSRASGCCPSSRASAGACTSSSRCSTASWTSRA